MKIALLHILTYSSSFLLAAAGAAGAQTNPGWIIEVIGGPVSPTNPQVTITVSAYFTPVTPTTAIETGFFSINSTDPTGAFGNQSIGSGLVGQCYFASFGTPTASGGLSTTQVAQWNVVGCSANPANPIEVWRGGWSTDNFTARSVDIATFFSAMSLYSDHGQPFGNIFFMVGEVIDGSATIQVVPAPSAALLLVSAGFLASKRRRP